MQVEWQENIRICSNCYDSLKNGKVSLTFNKTSISSLIYFFFLKTCSKLARCLLQLSLYTLTNKLQGGLLGFFWCAQLWSIIIKCLSLDGRGASSQTAIHQCLPSQLTSDLCSNNAASSRPTTQFSGRAGSRSRLQD